MSPISFLTAGFPGFVWAWFQIPNFSPGYDRLPHTLMAFGLPLIGFLVSALLFSQLRSSSLSIRRDSLVRVFATAAVVTYYWYRLPFLVGFSSVAPDGMLVDLTQWLPWWAPYAMRALTSTALVMWMLPSSGSPRPWLHRPPSSQEDAVVAVEFSAE
jgi:hypothetical protein